MSDSEARIGSAGSSVRSAGGSRNQSRGASSSPPPRSAGAVAPSSAKSSRRRSAGLSSAASGSSKKKKGTGKGKGKKGKSKKKKKKKPIVEEPKFVRDLIAKSEAGDVEWVRHFVTAPEYERKFDWNQTAGEALVGAAARNHADMVALLLQHGANPNQYSGKPLQRAALSGSLEAAEVLLQAGADVNAKSVWTEYVPLHYAAQVGSLPLVRLLLSSGALVDLACNAEQCATYNGWNALHFASDGGHLEIAALLLQNAANIDATNSNGDTPLAIAAERGQWEVARWLVAGGANIHAKRRGLSVVQWAIYRAAHEAVQFLVSYGARPELGVRTLWFPADKANLKEVIYAQLSEEVYDEIDLAIYRGGKQAMEREAKRQLIAGLQWESAPVFDPYSFDTTPQVRVCNFPQHVVDMISSYEM